MEFFRTIFSCVISENVATMPPVQDELTLTTKKRLQNLRRRSLGLEQLAVREISKQLTFYRKHPDELKKLKNLPGVLRDKILQVLMKKRCLDSQGQKMEFENLKVFFPLLLSPRTRYIELNGILSFCPDRYKNGKIEKVTEWCVKLLKQIETRAPQVETLVINRNNPFYTYSNYLKNATFSKEMVQSVMKLQKLNRLNVNLYNVQLNDLLKTCKNVSRLQYINVGLILHGDNDQSAPEDVSSSFRNLKELIIEFSCCEWLSCFCTRNLPNIEVVQYDPNKIVDWLYLTTCSDKYQGLNFPGFSNLRQIFMDVILDNSKAVKAMPTLFPKVTCLMIKNTGSLEADVMPKFDNIIQLHLSNPHCSGVFENYLDTYGRTLQSLYLGNDCVNSTIDLELIFKFCPKLEKLSLLNVCLKNPSSKIEFFAELKELEWLFHFHNSSSFGWSGRRHQQIMQLSNILSAPKLEKINLEGIILNENDLFILNSLIEEKRILKNLHTLHVYFNFEIPEGFANFLKSACAFLPKLTDFKFGRRYNFKDPLLANLSTILSEINASVCEMNAVFDNEN